MRKVLIITVTILGFLIITMVAVPLAFRSKIINKIKLAANEKVNAKVDFSDVQLSLFRSFPRLNVAIENLSVTGTNEFDNVRLLTAISLSTSVNLSGLWKSEGLSFTSIKLISPCLNLVVNKVGKSNWDIAKDSSSQTPGPDANDKQIDLKMIEIRNASFSYNDESSLMVLIFRNGAFDISGELKGNNSQLNITGQADSINFSYNGSQYVSGIKAAIKGGLQADFDKMSFSFLKNELMINNLPVEAPANTKMPLKVCKQREI
jgi:uncharacterized protein involved in outer membrane biogenesis